MTSRIPRRYLAAAGCVFAALGMPAVAEAGSVTIPNACLWSASGWERESLTLSGTALPERAAPGTAVALSGVGVRFVIAPEVVETGYRLDVLEPGENHIGIRGWIALRGANTSEGVQVRELTTTAITTIVTDAGGEFVSATPIDVQAALADSAWTTGAVFPTTFTQAEAGSLPASLPAGTNGAAVKPLGSAFFVASLGGLDVRIDCQPGTRSDDGRGPVPAPGAPFATVALPEGVVVPVVARPVLTLRSTRLRAARGRITVKLHCAAAPCAGTIGIATAGKVTVGRRKRILAVTPRASFSLAAGTSKSVTLKTTAAARKLLRTRTLTVRVTTKPSSGDPLSRIARLHGP